MIVADLFVDKETMRAAREFATNYKIKTEVFNPLGNCTVPGEREPYENEMKLLRDAFASGVAWAKLKESGLIKDE